MLLQLSERKHHETKDLRRAFFLCALFTVLNTLPAVLHGLETVELELDVRLAWNATRRENGPRCFTVRLDEPGYLLVELTTTSASTAPGIFVLAAEDGGVHPETVERIESVLLRVRRSGEQLICLTSGRPLGRVELVASFVDDGLVSKERDTEETELEPD